MPQIERHDGVPFVVYTYREIVTAKKYSLLVRELQMLAREHGNFARFYIFPDGDLEAVFSREPGYLLGENIWTHFGNPADLIYCEALSDGENALLVVVRDGSVYLDAELPITNLLDEFINLIGSENQYEIYVYGDIPLAKTATEEQFAFEPGMVKNFTELTTPVYPSLSTDETLKLIPINAAIKELPSQPVSYAKYIIVFVLLVLIGYGVWHTLSTPPPTTVSKAPEKTVKAPKTQNPYEGYYTALETPAPSEQLKAFLSQIKELLTVPGWTPVSMVLNEDQTQSTYKLDGVGGDTSLLLSWVKRNNANLSVQEGKATIVYPLNIKNRISPANIYNLRDTVSILYDGLHKIFPGANMTIGETKKVGAYNISTIAFSFDSVSMQILDLLADELQGFPVVIKQFSLSNIDHGIVSGNIELEVLGAAT